jgi:hypothetical protein
MNKKKNSLDPINQSEAAQRLADDLIEFDARTTTRVDDEMLSIIVDEAYRGIDISKRFPTIYRKLLNNANLRQAFIDILESLEKEGENELVAFPNKPNINLNFLKKHASKPIFEIIDQDNWRISWLRTFEQLQEIFSPHEFVFRLDADLVEDPWFTLLRKEFEVGKSRYTIVLDCTLSEKGDEVLSPYLNIAVTLGATSDGPKFPIHARLQWGAYEERIFIAEEGRIKLPDIPLSTTFDKEFNLVESELNFTLETTP